MRKLKRIGLIALSFALWGCSVLGVAPITQILPVGAPVVQKPRHEPGDWYEYDQWDPLCTRWEHKGIKEGFYIVQCGDHLEYLSDEHDTNLVKYTDLKEKVLSEYRPYVPYLSFPLWVGKEWSAEYFGFKAPDERWTSTLHARIESYEDVEVPAGKFKAFRIEYEDRQLFSNGASGTARYILWYTPEVKGLVKGVHLPRDPEWDFELVRYQVSR